MRTILVYIAIVFTTITQAQIKSDVTVVQKQELAELAKEITNEMRQTYPTDCWTQELLFPKRMLLKAGVAVNHKDNDKKKFLDLITHINKKIEGIDCYRIFSDRQNDENGICGRYVANVRPNEGDKKSTLFYKYKRMDSDPEKKDSISFVFSINMVSSVKITEDTKHGLRGINPENLIYKINKPSTEKDVKPLEDFFQKQYNDKRAIRKKATYQFPEDKREDWTIIFHNNEALSSMTTNAIYSQRPVNNSADFDALLQLTKKYKHQQNNIYAISCDKERVFLGLVFINKEGIPFSYQAAYENGVFSIMKATAINTNGICVISKWWE